MVMPVGKLADTAAMARALRPVVTQCVEMLRLEAEWVGALDVPTPPIRRSRPVPTEPPSSPVRRSAPGAPANAAVAAAAGPASAMHGAPGVLAPAASDITPSPEAAYRVSLPMAERERRHAALSEQAAACTACPLHAGRQRNVFARGALDAELAFVGEGPGHQEDRQGLPFVGPAGQLLDRMIVAMGYTRDSVYICNIVKCRPPDNRTPLPPEAAACLPWLEAQLQLVQPKVIVALGRCAAEHLGCMPPSGRGWRGRWTTWQDVPVLATYHPAYLLRTPAQKRTTWADLQQVMARLGRAPAAR